MVTRLARWGRIRLLVKRVETDSHCISVNRFLAVVPLAFHFGRIVDYVSPLLIIILFIVLFLIRRAVGELVYQAAQLWVDVIIICQAGEV